MSEWDAQMSDRSLVVIPALNEEASIAQVVKEVREALTDAHIVVVDDGSTDRTGELARAAGADVISLPFNIGVGGALRAGFRFAQRFGYQTVVQVDGDGQHDPTEVPRLFAALEGVDIVIGARFAGAGDYAVKGARKLAIGLLARSLSKRTGVKLTDTTSGFRAFNRHAVDVFARDYPAEYLGDTIEALLIASKAQLRVAQVPVHMRPRSGGTPSHQRIKSAIYLGRVLLALAISPLRR